MKDNAKKTILFTIGSVVASLAATAVTKKVLDKKNSNSDEDVDRGVSPVRIDENEKPMEDREDGVKDLKADAINQGYKPIKY